MPRRRAARKMVSPARMSTSRSSMVKAFALVVIRSFLASALILRDARTPIRACGTDGAHALLRMRSRAYLTPRLEFPPHGEEPGAARRLEPWGGHSSSSPTPSPLPQLLPQLFPPPHHR